MEKPRLPMEILEFFKQSGRKGGRIGGKRSLQTMTPDERTARAKKAAAASAKVRSAKARAKKRAAKGKP